MWTAVRESATMTTPGVLMRARTAMFIVVVIVLFLAAPAAAKSTRVGPHQHFVGLVNGQHTGAVILMACGGPSNLPRPPLGGQSLSIERVDANGAFTGSGAHSVIATFDADPSVTVRLRRYDVKVALPLTLRLPCEGTGTVTFSTCTTVRCPKGATADVVDVTFVNVAV